MEALITATNAGDIQGGRAASQKLPVPQPTDQSHALTKIAEDAANVETEVNPLQAELEAKRAEAAAQITAMKEAAQV